MRAPLSHSSQQPRDVTLDVEVRGMDLWLRYIKSQVLAPNLQVIDDIPPPGGWPGSAKQAPGTLQKKAKMGA